MEISCWIVAWFTVGSFSAFEGTGIDWNVLELSEDKGVDGASEEAVFESFE
jgi:hypothetical protein